MADRSLWRPIIVVEIRDYYPSTAAVLSWRGPYASSVSANYAIMDIHAEEGGLTVFTDTHDWWECTRRDYQGRLCRPCEEARQRKGPAAPLKPGEHVYHPSKTDLERQLRIERDHAEEGY